MIVYYYEKRVDEESVKKVIRPVDRIPPAVKEYYEYCKEKGISPFTGRKVKKKK